MPPWLSLDSRPPPLLPSPPLQCVPGLFSLSSLSSLSVFPRVFLWDGPGDIYIYIYICLLMFLMAHAVPDQWLHYDQTRFRIGSTTYHIISSSFSSVPTYYIFHILFSQMGWCTGLSEPEEVPLEGRYALSYPVSQSKFQTLVHSVPLNVNDLYTASCLLVALGPRKDSMLCLCSPSPPLSVDPFHHPNLSTLR